MSAVVKVVTLLRSVSEQLRLAEAALVTNPEDYGALLEANSLRAEHVKLESDFTTLASAFGVVRCDYRIIGEDQIAGSVVSLTSSLQAFQRLYSVVFDATVNGKKQRATLAKEVASKTAFQFGYAYTGSLGVVLTLPPETSLIDAEQYDKALDAVLAMASSRDQEELHHWADEIGVGPVNALHAWVRSHADLDTSAELIWRKEGEHAVEAFFAVEDFRRVKDEIERTSDESRRDFEVEGELTAADIESHQFTLRLDDETHIMGQAEADFGEVFTLELPRRYLAQVTESRSVNYATGEVTIKHFLNRLSDPPTLA